MGLQWCYKITMSWMNLNRLGMPLGLTTVCWMTWLLSSTGPPSFSFELHMLDMPSGILFHHLFGTLGTQGLALPIFWRWLCRGMFLVLSWIHKDTCQRSHGLHVSLNLRDGMEGSIHHSCWHLGEPSNHMTNLSLTLFMWWLPHCWSADQELLAAWWWTAGQAAVTGCPPS